MAPGNGVKRGEEGEESTGARDERELSGQQGRWRMNKGIDRESSKRKQTDGHFIKGCKHVSSDTLVSQSSF